jgi:L-aminopeptidase/D-esterase-like protein
VRDAITDVEGLSVGHWHDTEAATGCTVILCPEGAVAAVDVRGGAPATRNTDLLRQGNAVQQLHAVLLTGGSEFGLAAATGVVRWLEEKGYGLPLPGGVVPIVSAAVIFDLMIGRADVRPDAGAGYAACEAATSGEVAQGSVGVGSGATVGKALLAERAIKGGAGTAAERTASGIVVGAFVALNCWGEVHDPQSGELIAGPRGEQPGTFESTLETMRKAPSSSPLAAATGQAGHNTTLGVIATDARLTRDDAYRLAVMAQAGMARPIRPAHSPVDGDTVFALATSHNETPTDLLQLGTLAAQAMERAVVRAVREATGLCGVPSAREWIERTPTTAPRH